MSDPEILDPEGPAPSTTSQGVERLVAAVQKALPGRTVRVDVDERGPRTQVGAMLGGGPKFRLEATGEGGPMVVESGPFGTINVSFKSARFGFSGAVAGGDVDAAYRQVAERVRELADEELVVFEEPSSSSLLRTVILRVDAGRIEAVVDSGVLPGTTSSPSMHSFRGTWSRAPSKQEKKRIDKLTGGLVGRLKRKVLGKVFEKAAGSLAEAAQQVASDVQRDMAARADDGSRKLGPKD
jgi:hypothetical protein